MTEGAPEVQRGAGLSHSADKKRWSSHRLRAGGQASCLPRTAPSRPISPLPCQVERPFSPTWRVTQGPDSVCDRWCLEKEGLGSCLCPPSRVLPREAHLLSGWPGMSVVCRSQMPLAFPLPHLLGQPSLRVIQWGCGHALLVPGADRFPACPLCVFHLQPR